MLKAIERLLNGETNKVGNHSARHLNGVREFIYHWTIVCHADDSNRTYWVDNGGWGTSSTTRAMNDYTKYFDSIGYTRVDK